MIKHDGTWVSIIWSRWSVGQTEEVHCNDFGGLHKFEIIIESYSFFDFVERSC